MITTIMILKLSLTYGFSYPIVEMIVIMKKSILWNACSYFLTVFCNRKITEITSNNSLKIHHYIR